MTNRNRPENNSQNAASGPISRRIDRAGARLADAVSAHPLAILVAALAIASCSIWLATTRLALEPDVGALLPRDIDFLQDYNAYKRTFAYDRRTNIVVIDAPNADAADAAQARLAERLLDRHGDKFNAIRAPENDPFLMRHGLLYLELDALQALSGKLSRAQPALALLARDPSLAGLATVIAAGLEPAALEAGSAEPLADLMRMVATAAQQSASGIPSGVSWTELLLGSDHAASRRVVLAQGRLDGLEEDVGSDTGALIRDEAAALGLTPDNGYRIRLTGRGPLSAEEMNAAVADVQLAGFVSLGLLAIILWGGFRSVRVIAATLATVLIGLAWTMGFATLAVGQLNILSIVFAVLFIGLGVDFAIHGALRYLETGRGEEPAAAARGAVRAGTPALGLCALTSAIGFLAFWPTDYRGLAELGLISAGGMLLAYAASLTVLPALLVLFRTPPTGAAGIPGGDLIATLSKKSARNITIATVAAGIAMTAVSTQLAFNFNTLALKDPGSEAITAFQDLQADGIGTAYSLSIVYPDARTAEDARAGLAALRTVAAVEGPSDLIPVDQDAKLAIIDDLAIILWPVVKPGAAQPPASGARDALARLIVLAKRAKAEVDNLADPADRMIQELAGVSDANDLSERLTGGIPGLIARLRLALEAGPVSLENLPADIRSSFIAPDGAARLKVLPNADLTDYRELRTFVEAVAGLAPQATGRPRLEYETGRVVVDAFQLAIGLALVAVCAVLWIVLRSPRHVVLVLAPLLIAGAATLAFSVLAERPLNMASVIVLPLILGLGVDNGIHFVMRWREEGDMAAVMRSATLRAIVMSGLTTLASFGTLATVGNGAISGMGIMLMVGISAILVSMVGLLPALVSKIGHNR